MLLITGATGTIGRPLVELLAGRGAKLRAVTRKPSWTGLPAGVELVAGDPSRPGTLDAALEGVSAIFVNHAAVGGATAELLTLARSRGVRRVVLLSALAIEDEALRSLPIAREHLAIEEAVIGAGLEWVILRPGMFAANTLAWAPQVRAGDVIRGPYAASTDAPVHEADVAAAGASALLDDELLGRRLALSGPRSLTRAGMVAILGEVLGRPLHYQEISPEDAKRGMAAHGMPEPVIDTVLEMWRVGVGRDAVVADGVTRLLGRPPKTYAEWVADHAAAFGADQG